MTTPAQPLAQATLSDLGAVITQLETILMGKRHQLELAVACLLAEGHLLIEDVPGTGKTTLAQALSASFALPWNRVQFTSDLLPADIIGVSIFDTQSQQFEFRPGPVFTSVLLSDEINRAPPKAQSALLEAMEERQVSVDGHTHSLPENFFVIATQNPSEQLGAFPLPESQLDRFLLGISLGHPDPATERELLEKGDRRVEANQLAATATPRQLRQWIKDASDVHVSDTVYDYLLALILESRKQHQGLSSRAGLNLVKACKAIAFVQGRDHVLPDDVYDVFPALAGHRLTGKVSSGEEAAMRILNQVPSP